MRSVSFSLRCARSLFSRKIKAQLESRENPMLWVHKFSVRSVLLALGFAVLSPLIGAIAAEKLTAFYPFFPCAGISNFSQSW